MSSDDGQHLGRRSFFRDGLSRFLDPLVDLIEENIDLPVQRTLLRPPGAIPEEAFLASCLRCGDCAEACPADAISLFLPGNTQSAGTPYIDANQSACVVCDGLQCTHVCRSGALQPLNNPTLIAMGLAVVDQALCVRTQEEDCTVCLDRCPMGSTALMAPGAKAPVVLDGCVGCGVCQMDCPTDPKAIVIQPRQPLSI